MNMTLSIDVSRDIPVVRVAGELDHETVPALRAAMQETIDGHRDLILDLHAVTFLDSSALGMCVTHHKTLRKRGGSLRIANASSRALTLLTLSGLNQVLQLYPTLDAALAVHDQG